MKKIVGVRFKPVGKIYYFDPEKLDIKENDEVVVETAQGVEYATVVLVKEISDDEFDKPLKPIIRIATDEDKKRNAQNKKNEFHCPFKLFSFHRYFLLLYRYKKLFT